MCFVSICYGYVLYFSSLSLLQARSSPHDERQRERKGGQNRAPGDVDQQWFAFGDLRDDVLRRVGRFRGDDGGCNQRRGRDDGLLFVLVPKKKRGFRESSSSIRFLLRISTRVFPPLLYDQAGSLRRRDRKKINPADAQNLSSVFRTNLPSGKRKNHSGRDGRARKSSATSRARECTRRDFLRLFFSRATGGPPPPPPPPHFCALPVWTTTTEKSIVFLPKHTKGHIQRALQRKEEKKNKRKRPPKQTRASSSSSKSERTYLLDGWVFQRFRRFRARAFRLRGIRSRRLGDDFRGGGCNGVHDFFFLSRFFFVMMMNE